MQNIQQTRHTNPTLSAGFKPANPPNKRPQTRALDDTATRFGFCITLSYHIMMYDRTTSNYVVNVMVSVKET